MTTPNCLRLFNKASCFVHFQQRNFQGTNTLSKKQYEYDLDSLVKWKQETTLLFGPQRKLTKTGKLRKRDEKLEKQLLENIEPLSTISNANIDYSSTDCFDRPVVDTNGSMSDDINFPVFQFEVADVKRKNVEIKESVKKSKTRTGSKGTTTFSDTKPASPLEVNPTSNLFELERTKTNLLSSNEIEHHRAQISHSDDIDIPKIEPVPPEKENVLKKSFMPSMATLPLEPPASFAAVTNFPLVPQEISSSAETQQLKIFKMDVEKMALRVLPSVKTVLNKTMPELNKFFLNRWRERMINELGEEGFQRHKNETMRQGTNLHANIMEFLSGKREKELQIMPENEGHWTSLHTALQSVADIRALEMDVLHPALLYRGVFDCVGRYKDLLCVIDWKVSKKPRPLLKNTYDDPIQVAAYVGALNSTGHYRQQHGEINHGLIVVAYPDGSPAHAHMMSRAQVEHYWLEWTARLHSFYTLTYTEKCAQKSQASPSTPQV